VPFFIVGCITESDVDFSNEFYFPTNYYDELGVDFFPQIDKVYWPACRAFRQV